MKLNDIFSKGYFRNLEVSRIAIIGLTILTIGFLFQSIILGYVAMRRQNLPYVVEIDSQSGEVLNTKVLDNEYKNNSMKEKQVDYFLSKIIIAVRSIPTD